MNEEFATAPLQCCLVCGRTITNREQHEALEERVLAAIREAHPDWAEGDGTCSPCVVYYRRLLKDRGARVARRRQRARRRMPEWMQGLFGRNARGGNPTETEVV